MRNIWNALSSLKFAAGDLCEVYGAEEIREEMINVREPIRRIYEELEKE